MPLFDLPLEALQQYLPERHEADDFDTFWNDTLSEARGFDLKPRFTAVDEGLHTLDSFDVSFSGYGGQSIKAWLLLPRGLSNLPCVVEFIGYGGGRGFPSDWLLWSSSGMAHLIMDTRGQGSVWRKGDTPDIDDGGSNPQHPGFMTRGILDPKTYYYRRLMTDAVRAVETAQSFDRIDSNRIAVTGGSQGGGLALAVAGLLPEVSVTMPEVPFLCHYRRATELIDTKPYEEITHFCKIHRDKVETVFTTLSYFDGVNFATRAKARAFFSVALMDTVCPPSTVYAAYNHYASDKDIRVYPYNNHEGGETFHKRELVRFLQDLWL